jgi:aryl-alcohol dehydrogenase-like predicted oxidoreductase
MRNKVLGNCGLFVSEMCLGTKTFGPSTGRYPAWMFAMADAARANLLRSGVLPEPGARA